MKSFVTAGIVCLVLLMLITSADAGEKPARVDSYGDPLPAGAIGRLGTVRMRHGDSTFSVAFSPAGKIFATGGGRDGEIVLWDVKTGKRVATLTGHKGTVYCLAFSPDGKTLASAGHDKTVRLWDVATGKETQRTLAKNRIIVVAFHNNRKALVFRSEGNLYIWYPDQRKDKPVVLKGTDRTVVSATILSDGKTIVSKNFKNNILSLWDANTGRQIGRIDSPSTSTHRPAISPDGKTLAYGCMKDGTVHLWSLEQKKELFVLEGHEAFLTCLAFSPDGKTLAVNSGGDYTVRLWDLATKKEIRRLPGVGGKWNCLAFSPDSKTLAVLRADKSVGLWDVNTGKSVHNFAGHTDQIYALAFSPDGKRLASGAVSSALGPKAGIDNTIRIWDVSKQREIVKWPAHGTRGANSLAWMPDGKAIVSCGAEKSARMWDAKTGKPIRVFGPHKQSVSSVDVSPDGKIIATGGSNDRKMYLWNTATGERFDKLERKVGRGVKLAFSGTGKALAATHLASIRIWRIPPDKSVIRCAGLRQGFIPQLSFSPNGRLIVSASHSGRITLSDAMNGNLINTMTLGSSVNGVAFSPDGKLIASAGRDKVVRVWETATGKQVLEFAGHVGSVNAVAFSPDGRTLASAGADTTILLWDIDPWVCRNDSDKTSPLKMDDCKPAYLWDKLKGKGESSDHSEYAIMWVLVRGGDKAVGLLDIFLKPVHIDSARVKQLIANLDDDKYKVREQASEELAGFGNAIDSDIREALKKPTSLEAKIRLEELMKVVSYPLPKTPESLRKYRSVQILEWIGTKKAQGVLKKLAAGHAGAPLTQDAKSALARIASRN